MGKGRKVPPVSLAHSKVDNRPILLWIGDAVAHTGFANVTHNILDRLHKSWRIHILGINYLGDPHPYPYGVWPAATYYHPDVYGRARLADLLRGIKPNVVMILNDPWIVKTYLPILRDFPDIVKVAYSPIDGDDISSAHVIPLNELDRLVAYNNYGADQLRKAGYTGKLDIIRHGVDRSVFYPMPREEARKNLGIPADWFIVGCVARNQFRKRLDLLVQAFAIFAKDKPDNVMLHYHGALIDAGWDVEKLAERAGIGNRLMTTSRNITSGSGVPSAVMNNLYNMFDVFASTTLGEGHGLPHSEAAACGIPQVVPNWSALGEWLTQGAILVPCRGELVNTGGINTVGGVIDPYEFAEALNKLYYSKELRTTLGNEGIDLVKGPDFDWDIAARQFDTLFKEILNDKSTPHKQGTDS